MEEKSQNRRLIEILIIIFVIAGTFLVLSEIYQNVSNKLYEKESVRDQTNEIICLTVNSHSEEIKNEEPTIIDKLQILRIN